jgi:hypothetical protein
MKVRTDFVTNSSSSSFTVVSIQSKKVDEFVKGQLCTPEEADKWLNTKEFLTRLSECLGMKDGDERAGYGFPVGLAPVETLIALIAKAKKLDRFFNNLEGDADKFAKFLQDNSAELNKEMNGVIYSATIDEVNIAQINALKFNEGKLQTLDVEYELEFDDDDDGNSNETIDRLFEKYGVTVDPADKRSSDI